MRYSEKTKNAGVVITLLVVMMVLALVGCKQPDSLEPILK